MNKQEMVMSLVSKEELVELYRETPNVRMLAEQFSVSPQTMIRVMDNYGISRLKPIGNKKHHFNESYFKSIDTEEKAYWLGFLMADGCVYQGTGTTYRLQINLKYDDLPHLNKFQQAIGSDYKIQIKKVNESKAAQLKINSTEMCKDLIALGVIPRKSIVCTMPYIHNDLIRHFIRGYFDGDGSVHLTLGEKVNKQFSICGGQPMLREINKHLNITLRDLKRGNDLFIIETGNKDDMLRLYNYLYDEATVYLQRKKRNFDLIQYLLISPLMA